MAPLARLAWSIVFEAPDPETPAWRPPALGTAICVAMAVPSLLLLTFPVVLEQLLAHLGLPGGVR